MVFRILNQYLLNTLIHTDLFQDIFKSNFTRGKERFLSATKRQVKISSKTSALKFCLPKNTSHTSLATEELELLQAGMRRQTVTFPENGDHTEVQ